MKKMSIHQRIKEARVLLGLSEQELADVGGAYALSGAAMGAHRL